MSATKQMVDSFGRSFEENKTRLELMEKANEEARQHWNDPQWRRDFAADLTEDELVGLVSKILSRHRPAGPSR